MSNQNNLYPEITNEPLINQPQTYPPKYTPPATQVQPNYNQPTYLHQANQPFPNYNHPQNNQGFQQIPQIPPPAQPVQPVYQNQGYQPPKDQGFSPSGSLHCPYCGRWTESIPRKVAGGVTYLWCFSLFLLTGIGCVIPFCVDGCRDTVMMCVVCQGVKARITANCC